MSGPASEAIGESIRVRGCAPEIGSVGRACQDGLSVALQPREPTTASSVSSSSIRCRLRTFEVGRSGVEREVGREINVRSRPIAAVHVIRANCSKAAKEYARRRSPALQSGRHIPRLDVAGVSPDHIPIDHVVIVESDSNAL